MDNGWEVITGEMSVNDGKRPVKGTAIVSPRRKVSPDSYPHQDIEIPHSRL